MSHDFKDMNLPCDPLDIRLIFYLVLLQDFYGYFFACQYVRAQPDLAESALAQRPAFNQVIMRGILTYQQYSGRSNDC